ncbi:sorting nexin mvp1 [Mytilinidion resinicola]|uniref:Sorting nexin MVP1 n=1 Tax=Mytilinidion resinicola TaxID=574789 RepID=A0A6A6YK86_9PEZI|nr:sorting nexin mvp1 [Mytilinidion resinicola]KAF2809231.1 sorting nexin mvp1 [Mytilinidion resinicola]
MSLFGDDDLPARPKQSTLFDDEPKPAARSGSSLFTDDFNDAGDSPWGLPTPKKAARGNLVKTLLGSGDVPESYVDAFDALIASGDRTGSGVSLAGVKKLLADSGLPADVQATIVGIVAQPGQDSTAGFGRGEFNVLLALIGLAQEGEDVTLDSVDDHRRHLPEPSIKLPTPPQVAKPTTPLPPHTPATPRSQPAATPSQPRAMRKESFGFPEADPWSSPALHRGHEHIVEPGAPPINGATLSSAGMPGRTTSAFTTASDNTSSPPPSNHIGERPTTGGTAGWGAYNGSSHDGFSGAGLGDGFGNEGGDEANRNPGGLGRSLGGGRVAGSGVEEVITVTAIAEKEGMFLFQHRNYEVTSARRNSKVIRRYSDFVWLLDCLHKRYPFRQLPLLPPKRVAINGNYLAADASFVEKRRRGLARFANALVRHPVLSQEQLVVMFLTVPTELAVWRKQATISVQEEFTGKSLPPSLEDSLPQNLQDLFDQVRSGVRRSAETYINLCNLMERLCKRNEGLAAEYLRFSLALQTLTEASSDTYAVDANDVPMLNEGLNSTAKHLSASQALLEDEGRAWDEGVLEDLKRQRDCLVSMRDLFDRRDRYAKDNIPQLEKRIQNNENKLQAIRNKPEALQKPNEAEKVEEAIVRDKQSIVAQHARGVFIKECVRDELLFFQHSQYHISRLHQDWSQERVKYAELQADNWRGLSEEVESMPIGD